MTQVTAFQRMMETLAQLAPSKPEMLDKLDPDGIVDFMADVYDVSYKTLLTQDQVDQLRQQRAQAQQQQTQQQMMNTLADSANKAGGAASAFSKAQNNMQGVM